VITEAEVSALMAKISEQNNTANTTYDTELQALYEGEASLASDSAYFTASKALDPNGAKAPKPFTYQVQGARVPAAAPGSQWFVVDAKIDRSTGNYPLVIAREGVDQPWKMVHTAAMKELLPATAKDTEGNAAVVAPDDGAALVAAPAKAAEAHAAFIAGDKTAGGGLFAADTTTAKYVEQDKARKAIAFDSGPANDFTVASVVAPYPVRALRTADGGALVAYTTQTTYTAVKPGAKPKLTGILGALAPKNLTDGQITVEVLNMWWALVPKSGDAVTVLGGTSQPVKIS
jgi:hypothetical protein